VYHQKALAVCLYVQPFPGQERTRQFQPTGRLPGVVEERTRAVLPILTASRSPSGESAGCQSSRCSEVSGSLRPFRFDPDQRRFAEVSRQGYRQFHAGPAHTLAQVRQGVRDERHIHVTCLGQVPRLVLVSS
jgi:hypothetical protein